MNEVSQLEYVYNNTVDMKKQKEEKIRSKYFGVYVPDGCLRVGDYVRIDGVWYDIRELTQIKRSSLDICYFGGKSRGKNIIMTYNAFCKYLQWKELGLEKTVYSNYHLNFPHVYIDSIHWLDQMRDGIFLGDDIEQWLSSKFGKSIDKANVLEIMLNLGKRNVDVLWSCKRPLGVIKDLRDTTDYFIEVDMTLQEMPLSVEEYMFKVQFLDFCKITCEVYDYKVEWIKDEELFDLEVYCKLYDTKEEIKKLKS